MNVLMTLMLSMGIYLTGCSGAEPLENTETILNTTNDLPQEDIKDDNLIVQDIEIDDVVDSVIDNEELGSTMKIYVGDTVLNATLVDNSSTEALKELLAEKPLVIDMVDYGNMEKVGGLGTSLPTNNQQITAQPCDIILYQGNALVIYYEPNSWNFTKLGTIQGVTKQELKSILGEGNVTVTLTLE